MNLKFTWWFFFVSCIALFAESEEVFSLKDDYKTVLIRNNLNQLIKNELKDDNDNVLFSEKFQYDQKGNLLKITTDFYRDNKWMSQACSFSYNDNNQITSIIRGYDNENERKITYAYDQNNRLILKTNSGGVQIHLIYDGNNLCNISSSDNSINYRLFYNEKIFLIKAEDRILNQTINRQVDELGNILKETFPNGEEISVSYNKEHKPIIVKNNQIGEIHYIYDKNNLIKVQRFSNEHQELYSHRYYYDEENNLVKEDLIGNLGQLEYFWNNCLWNNEKKLWRISTPYSLEEGAYDASANLIFHKKDDEISSYQYDSFSRLVTFNDFDFLNNPKSAKINNLNELLQDGKISCEYDLNGNLIAKHTPEKTCFYTYDALNRLIKIKTNQLEVQFTYDFWGRRLSKTVYKNNEMSKENYLYQDTNEIASFKNGNLNELRIPGKSFHKEIVKAIAIEKNKHIYAPIYDFQGNIFKLVDIKNRESHNIGYINPFGSNLDKTFKSKYSSWLFSSKRYDPETNLIYFGQRYYDPTLKRWITTDPFWFKDGMNLYTYALNNPFRYADPNGNFAVVLPLIGIGIKAIIDATAAGLCVWGIAETAQSMNKKMG